MKDYQLLVAEYARLMREGKSSPLGGFARLPRPAIRPGAPTALLFAPHPDDEVIIGGMALRLMREAGFRIVNVAVTLGSNEARRAGRLKELAACCDCIGFELLQTAPGGLERVNLKARAEDPAHWARSVGVIAGILARHQPNAIFFPHEGDWNSSHIGTHHLVVDALRSLGPTFRTCALETEFWGAMRTPNLMVESSAGDVADLITALTFHVGEVQRNPHHLSLPAWMIDNVRRGGEVVLGQGATAPAFTFATLYRLQRWQNGSLVPALGRGRAVSAQDDVAALLASV
jgi:LmbE family N-acetylglucosaminyl deacetylase